MPQEPITRRTASGLILGFASVPAWGQLGAIPDTRWGIFAELAGSAFRASYVGGGATEQSVIFVEWEIPGQVLSFTRVSQGLRHPQSRRHPPGRRDLVFYRLESDGRITGTWEDRPIEVQITPQGSAVGFYEINGRAYRSEIARTSPDAFRMTIVAGGGTGIRDAVRVERDEAMRLAADYYPAEFAPQRPRPQRSRQISDGQECVSSDRFALVIGVSAYQHLPVLPNPVNDARAVAQSLCSAGFQVDLRLDSNLTDLQQGLDRLNARIVERRAGTGALVYFAGHGVQWNGGNYILPRDGKLSSSDDLQDSSLSADFLLERLDRSAAATSIIILDACRNIPGALAENQTSPGLAHILAPSGSYVAYSTAPGTVAVDGDGHNSPFAAALTAELARPSLPIEMVFKNVRRSVLRETAGQQTPWDSSSLTEPFYFRG